MTIAVDTAALIDFSQVRARLCLDIIHRAEQFHPLEGPIMARMWHPGEGGFDLSSGRLAPVLARSERKAKVYRAALTQHEMWERIGRTRYRMRRDDEAELLERVQVSPMVLPKLRTEPVLAAHKQHRRELAGLFSATNADVSRFAEMDPEGVAVAAGVSCRDEVVLLNASIPLGNLALHSLLAGVGKWFDVSRNRADAPWDVAEAMAGLKEGALFHDLGVLNAQGVWQSRLKRRVLHFELTASGGAAMEKFLSR